jgi:glucosylceramidase
MRSFRLLTVTVVVGMTALVIPGRRPLIAADEPVSVWLTTGDKSQLLAPQPSLAFGPASSSRNYLTIDVDETLTYQRVEGFGGSLTDSAAWLIAGLGPAQRDALMRNLFDPATGIGLSLVRQPIGASDFALAHYTYDDTCCTLSDFSIEHDRAYILPLLHQALSLNPALRVMGSPWSAPGWMKDSGSLYGGKLLAQDYGLYADYFVKYVTAYEDEGIPVGFVTLQNEPHYEPPDYPGMRWEPSEEADFVKNHLGPAFETNGISTKIIVWDHNWDEPGYPIAVLDDPAAKPYIDGSAFHCYGGSVDTQSQVHDAHPDRNIYFTECTSGAWSTDWASNLLWDFQNLLIGNFRNWGVATIKYNLALDQNYGPHTGGCTNCTGLATIDTTDGSVGYNHDFYALGHFSRFVAPGAVRIESNQFDRRKIYDVSFKNPDGSRVVVVANAGRGRTSFMIRWAGQSIVYTLPGQSAATFKW